MRTIRTLFIGLAFLVFTLPGLGQTATTGTVQGSTTDPQGSVVAGAEVKLLDKATNKSRVEITDENGLYTFANIPPGNYSVSVTKTGFRKSLVADLAVEVNKSNTLNIVLEVGQVTEVVQVTDAVGAELQTTDAQVGNVVGTRTLRSLPTVTRSTLELLSLQPTTTPGGLGTGGTVSGARSDQNSLIVDGIDVSDNLAGGQGVAFTQTPVGVDSISEFRVTVANPNATFGRSAGGQISLVTPRGGNVFHGTGYWFHQNDNLNANSWTNNRTGTKRGELKDNRAGVSGNGPIWKDHTFFSANYEIRRFPQIASFTRTVPTASLRAGTLRFRDAANNIVSYPLATSAVCGPAANLPCDPRGLGLSPTISAMFAKMPEGNDITLGDGLNTTGYRGAVKTSLKLDSVSVRGDHKISDKLQLMGKYSYQADVTPNTAQLDISDAANVQSLRALTRRGDNYVVGLDYTITNSIVNSFRFGWVRNKNDLIGMNPFAVAARLNLAGTTTTGGQVGLDLGGLNEAIDVAAQSARTQIIQDKSIQYSDNLFWSKGKHSFSFGADIRFLPMTFTHNDQVTFLTGPIAAVTAGSNLTISDVNRPIPCSATVTTNCLPTTQNTNWNTLYAAALGMLDNVSIVGARDGSLQPLPFGTDLVTEANLRYYQFNFQDIWRKSSSLTFTFGLNYGWLPPPTERLDRFTFITNLASGEIYTADSYLKAKRDAAAQGQVFNPTFGIRPINDSNRKTIFDTDWSNLGPRLAVAWNPATRNGFLGSLMGNRRTVLRGGFAIVHDRVNSVTVILPSAFGIGFGQVLNLNAPFCNATTAGAGCNAAVGASNRGLSAFRLGRDGNVPLPGFSGSTSPIVPPNTLGTTYAVDPSRKIGRNYTLDFTIQRELPGSLVLEVGYIGRLGRDLPTGIDLGNGTSPYFFKDSASGQTFADAYDKVALALRAGTAFGSVPTQAWFDNQLPNLSANGSASFAGCRPPAVTVILTSTQCMARLLGSSFINNSVGTIFANMGSFRSVLGLQPYNSQQLAALLMATSGGKSNYHAAFVTLRNRLSHGLMFDVNYTFSKSLDQVGDVQNNLSIISTGFDRNIDYGFSQADRTHVFNGIFTYDLPFGKGRQYLNGGGASDKVVGGWYVSGIYRMYSGLPFFVGDSSSVFGGLAGVPTQGAIPLVDPSTLGAGIYRGVTGSNGVGTAGSPAAGGTGLNLFANPEAAFKSFRRMLLSQDGRQGRAMAFRGPWFWNLDFRLGKATRISERVNFEISADFFNIFNRVNLTTASLSLNSPANFGVISGPANSSRSIQIGGRLSF